MYFFYLVGVGKEDRSEAKVRVGNVEVGKLAHDPLGLFLRLIGLLKREVESKFQTTNVLDGHVVTGNEVVVGILEVDLGSHVITKANREGGNERLAGGLALLHTLLVSGGTGGLASDRGGHFTE